MKHQNISGVSIKTSWGGMTPSIVWYIFLSFLYPAPFCYVFFFPPFILCKLFTTQHQRCYFSWYSIVHISCFYWPVTLFMNVRAIRTTLPRPQVQLPDRYDPPDLPQEGYSICARNRHAPERVLNEWGVPNERSDVFQCLSANVFSNLAWYTQHIHFSFVSHQTSVIRRYYKNRCFFLLM